MALPQAADPGEPTLGRRPAKARLALIDATKRLLARRDFAGFTIDDVAREAGVARGSFYNHFRHLDELVRVTRDLVQVELASAITAAIADSRDAPTSIARGIATMMCFGYANRADAPLLMGHGRGAADPASAGNALLAAALHEGVDRGDLDIRTLEMGFVAVRGICELGLSRMLAVHHEFSAVRELTLGMCVSALRALGVPDERAEPVATAAVADAFSSVVDVR